jgi:hypothetical protein
VRRAGIQLSSTATIVTNLHDFLAEHAKFPFPQPESVDTTDLSLLEVAFLDREWKPKHVVRVRDNTIVQELCSTLKNILGDTILVAGAENQLLARFFTYDTVWCAWPRRPRLDRESKRNMCKCFSFSFPSG